MMTMFCIGINTGMAMYSLIGGKINIMLFNIICVLVQLIVYLKFK